MGPPGCHVLHQYVHHEVLGQGVMVVVLQQEAHLAEVEVGHSAAIGGQGEPEILIELPGEREVAGGHEGLDFSYLEIGHGLLVAGAGLKGIVAPV
ncbi:hypothetical protein D3C80_1802470 [compost metagenome]